MISALEVTQFANLQKQYLPSQETKISSNARYVFLHQIKLTEAKVFSFFRGPIGVAIVVATISDDKQEEQITDKSLQEHSVCPFETKKAIADTLLRCMM